ncbi:uncharacterized protein K452DRAFT_356693 [Aplosporella prunicola CBS 121167]|uniref:DNA-directed RNA polymerase I subunit RPA34.5 n=1 Tax=Aplosporella prunicola CBS 121167 TaxID=1176127 RepID=A0A6A6BLG9_9PEZI|nr:uncharacterized protein K452DRAFT_356693 [Aplosporella prunicola CBS 121167]KAF2144518.1 hypothetical protein K452DRAFT_356693 [Aplosporella prunicola CBS 121167]
MAKVKTTRVPLPGENPKKAPKVDETARKNTKPVSGEVIVESDDASDSDSSSGRSAGSTSDTEKQKNTRKPNVKKVKKTEVASPSVPSDESSEEESGSEESESGSDSSSESGSEDSSSESESSEDEKATSQAPAAAARVHTTQLRPAKAFEPPPGFKATDFRPNPSSNLSKILSSNLENKQLWHITAPSTVPIKQIKEFARGKAMGKETVIQHGGVDYGFVPQEKETQVATRLMIPTDQGYVAVPSDFAETLHLQEIIHLPNLSNKQSDPARGSDAAASFTVPAAKPIRQQPKGLRMRYRPYGAVDTEAGVIGSSDSEGDESLQIRPKRKHEGIDGTEAAAKKAKKDKKHRSKEAEAPSTGDAMEIDSEVPKGSNDSEKKKKKKDKEKKEKKEKKK